MSRIGIRLYRITELLVAFEAIPVHVIENLNTEVDVVINQYFFFPRKISMQASAVLCKRALPAERHCKHKRVEPRIVKAFSGILSRRKHDKRFGCGNFVERFQLFFLLLLRSFAGNHDDMEGSVFEVIF